MQIRCVQLNSRSNIFDNWVEFESLARRAVETKSHNSPMLIAAPECCNFMPSSAEHAFDLAKVSAEDEFYTRTSAIAKELDCWILLGSLILKLDGREKLANRQVLYNNKGDVVSVYDKIHLFDVSIPDGQVYQESSTYNAGSDIVTSSVDSFTLGHSICFDLRFPLLYQSLARRGANVLVVPAAFTRFTGLAHWHTLLRARAIETGSYVIAPAQCGEHDNGRETYGHSMIISPWGEVLAEAGENPTFIGADIDMAAVNLARSRIPTLELARDLT